MAKQAQPVEQYLEKVRTDLIGQQKKLKFWASGRSAKTLKIVEDKRFKRPEAVFKLSGDRRANITYFTMQEGGRKPGKWPPPPSLERWIEKKKIKIRAGRSIEQVAYLIGKQLAEKGNQVFQKKRTPLNLDKIVEKNLPKLVDEIADDAVDAVLEVIDRTLPVKR